MWAFEEVWVSDTARDLKSRNKRMNYNSLTSLKDPLANLWWLIWQDSSRFLKSLKLSWSFWNVKWFTKEKNLSCISAWCRWKFLFSKQYGKPWIVLGLLKFQVHPIIPSSLKCCDIAEIPEMSDIFSCSKLWHLGSKTVGWP